MNTKRQTIWLVSMLSLMVVLSAYYLFTDSVGEMNVASEDGQQGQSTIDAVEVGEHDGMIDLEELAAAEDQTFEGGAASSITDGEGGELAADEWSVKDDSSASKPAAKSDADILQKVQAGAQTGEERISAPERKRTEDLTRETEKWMNIATDPKKSTEEIGKAEDQLRVIEETTAIVSDLEDELMREYQNVVITQEGGKWSVLVQADKLQRSEVVTIIDMIAEHLKVNPGKVTVEYVS